MMFKLATLARILRPSERVEEAAKCNDEALVALKKEIVLAAPAAKDWPDPGRQAAARGRSVIGKRINPC